MTLLNEPVRPGVRTPPCVEPTLDDLLSDPLVLAVMRADGVDAGALSDVLTSAAGRLRERRGKAGAPARESKFDPLTARYFPPPVRVSGAAAEVDAPNASVPGKGSKSACGTPCPW